MSNHNVIAGPTNHNVIAGSTNHNVIAGSSAHNVIAGSTGNLYFKDGISSRDRVYGLSITFFQ